MSNFFFWEFHGNNSYVTGLSITPGTNDRMNCIFFTRPKEQRDSSAASVSGKKHLDRGTSKTLLLQLDLRNSCTFEGQICLLVHWQGVRGNDAVGGHCKIKKAMHFAWSRDHHK
jgi:hypothetical protein